MKTDEIENEPELQQVLLACYKYWQDESLPANERVICYNWIVGLYSEKFGAKFHPSRLRHLIKLGFLKENDTSRGGHRRYYEIINPDQVHELLMKWGLIR
jgi:hypothetical protein